MGSKEEEEEATEMETLEDELANSSSSQAVTTNIDST